jgi:iron(III) transport system substrate-binding protein
VPEEYKANILETDQNPLVCVYLNRLFIYNDGGDKEAKPFKNVWQFADPEFKGTEFKNPMDEKSSMNFLISLTSEKWQAKLAEAYKSYYGKDWVSTGEFENISLEWIYKFLMNCTFVSKDSTIASDIASGAAGSVGLFVFSKLRSVDATNISVCAKDGIEGFAGLLYPIYSMIAANAKYPYSACLYINYLLSEEGYNNIFGSQMGTYSVNSATGIGENAKAYGDEPLSFWQDCLVIEDAEHVQNVYFEVFDQISQWCASK